MRAAAVVIGLGEIRPQLDRPVIIGDRPVVFPLLVEGQASVAVGVRVLRVEPDRLVIVRDGPDVVILPVIGDGAIGEGQGVLRVVLERRVEIGDGPVEQVLVQIGHAPFGERDGGLPIRKPAGADHLVVEKDGSVEVAALSGSIGSVPIHPRALCLGDVGRPARLGEGAAARREQKQYDKDDPDQPSPLRWSRASIMAAGRRSRQGRRAPLFSGPEFEETP